MALTASAIDAMLSGSNVFASVTPPGILWDIARDVSNSLK
jgi:hypothetical protein